MSDKPHHYAPLKGHEVPAITKDEHDLLVALLGRPLTQDPPMPRPETATARPRND